MENNFPKKLKFNTRQVRYCGTNFTVFNVPYDMPRELVLKAVGECDGWWVSGYHRSGKDIEFNINYD